MPNRYFNSSDYTPTAMFGYSGFLKDSDKVNIESTTATVGNKMTTSSYEITVAPTAVGTALTDLTLNVTIKNISGSNKKVPRFKLPIGWRIQNDVNPKFRVSITSATNSLDAYSLYIAASYSRSGNSTLKLTTDDPGFVRVGSLVPTSTANDIRNTLIAALGVDSTRAADIVVTSTSATTSNVQYDVEFKNTSSTELLKKYGGGCTYNQWGAQSDAFKVVIDSPTSDAIATITNLSSATYPPSHWWYCGPTLQCRKISEWYGWQTYNEDFKNNNNSPALSGVPCHYGEIGTNGLKSSFYVFSSAAENATADLVAFSCNLDKACRYETMFLLDPLTPGSGSYKSQFGIEVVPCGWLPLQDRDRIDFIAPNQSYRFSVYLKSVSGVTNSSSEVLSLLSDYSAEIGALGDSPANPRIHGRLLEIDVSPITAGARAKIVITGTSLSGNFNLTYNSLITKDIAWSSVGSTLASNIETALNQLSPLNRVAVEVISCSSSGAVLKVYERGYGNIRTLFCSSSAVPNYNNVTPYHNNNLSNTTGLSGLSSCVITYEDNSSVGSARLPRSYKAFKNSSGSIVRADNATSFSAYLDAILEDMVTSDENRTSLGSDVYEVAYELKRRKVSGIILKGLGGRSSLSDVSRNFNYVDGYNSPYMSVLTYDDLNLTVNSNSLVSLYRSGWSANGKVRCTITGTSVAGTFTLSVNGFITAPITYNNLTSDTVARSTIKAALLALNNVASIDVAIITSFTTSGGVFEIYGWSLYDTSATAVNAVALDTSSLTGVTSSSAVFTDIATINSNTNTYSYKAPSYVLDVGSNSYNEDGIPEYETKLISSLQGLTDGLGLVVSKTITISKSGNVVPTSSDTFNIEVGSGTLCSNIDVRPQYFSVSSIQTAVQEAVNADLGCTSEDVKVIVTMDYGNELTYGKTGFYTKFYVSIIVIGDPTLWSAASINAVTGSGALSSATISVVDSDNFVSAYYKGNEIIQIEALGKNFASNTGKKIIDEKYICDYQSLTLKQRNYYKNFFDNLIGAPLDTLDEAYHTYMYAEFYKQLHSYAITLFPSAAYVGVYSFLPTTLWDYDLTQGKYQSPGTAFSKRKVVLDNSIFSDAFYTQSIHPSVYPKYLPQDKFAISVPANTLKEINQYRAFLSDSLSYSYYFSKTYGNSRPVEPFCSVRDAVTLTNLFPANQYSYDTSYNARLDNFTEYAHYPAGRTTFNDGNDNLWCPGQFFRSRLYVPLDVINTELEGTKYFAAAALHNLAPTIADLYTSNNGLTLWGYGGYKEEAADYNRFIATYLYEKAHRLMHRDGAGPQDKPGFWVDLPSGLSTTATNSSTGISAWTAKTGIKVYVHCGRAYRDVQTGTADAIWNAELTSAITGKKTRAQALATSVSSDVRSAFNGSVQTAANVGAAINAADGVILEGLPDIVTDSWIGDELYNLRIANPNKLIISDKPMTDRMYTYAPFIYSAGQFETACLFLNAAYNRTPPVQPFVRIGLDDCFGDVLLTAKRINQIEQVGAVPVLTDFIPNS